jgi:hypothetical protein
MEISSEAAFWLAKPFLVVLWIAAVMLVAMPTLWALETGRNAIRSFRRASGYRRRRN